MKKEGHHPEIATFLGCCYFFLGMYKEADEVCARGPLIKYSFSFLPI